MDDSSAKNKGEGITVDEEEPMNQHDEQDLSNRVKEEALHRTISDLKDKLAKAQRLKEANLHRTISELKDKLATSERLTEKASKEAEEYKERRDFLEEQLEKKSVMELQKEELAKKTSDMEKLLDDERKKHEEERKKVADLDRQLMEERNRGNEDLMRYLEDRMRDQKKAEDILLEFNAANREKELLERRWDELQKEKEEINRRIRDLEKMLEQASTPITNHVPRMRINRERGRDGRVENAEVSFHNGEPVEIVDLTEVEMEIPVQISEPIDVPDASTPLNDHASSLIMNGGEFTVEREETVETSMLNEVSLDGIMETEDSLYMHNTANAHIDISDHQFEAMEPMVGDDLVENGEEDHDIIEHATDFPMDFSETNIIDRDMNNPMTPEESTKIRSRSRSMKITEPVDESDSEGEGQSVKKKSGPAKKRGEGSSDTREMGKRRTSARMINYAESMEGSDWEEGPKIKKDKNEGLTVKKAKIEHASKNDKKQKSSGSSQFKPVKKENSEKNELQCPMCKFRTRSISSWDSHLRDNHSITTRKAGYLLRCDCGEECYSDRHSRHCEITNFTLIRKEQKTIHLTPQCVSCENYPTTVGGFVSHLKRHHKTTLMKEGIYLVCKCGFKYNSYGGFDKHDNKCAGDDYTLHKIDEE